MRGKPGADVGAGRDGRSIPVYTGKGSSRNRAPSVAMSACIGLSPRMRGTPVVAGATIPLPPAALPAWPKKLKVPLHPFGPLPLTTSWIGRHAQSPTLVETFFAGAFSYLELGNHALNPSGRRPITSCSSFSSFFLYNTAAAMIARPTNVKAKGNNSTSSKVSKPRCPR